MAPDDALLIQLFAPHGENCTPAPEEISYQIWCLMWRVRQEEGGKVSFTVYSVPRPED